MTWENLMFISNEKKNDSNVIEKLVEHCLPCSYTNDITDLSS